MELSASRPTLEDRRSNNPMALNLSAALQSSPVHSFLRPVRLKALDSSNRAPRELATPHHTLSNQCTLQPQPPSFLVSTRFLSTGKWTQSRHNRTPVVRYSQIQV